MLKTLQLRGKAKVIAVGVGLVCALLLSACGGSGTTSEEGSSYPSKDLEWLVPYGATSGANAMVRAIQQIIEDDGLYPKNMVVKNVEGGGGSTGYSQLFAEKGNPYILSPTVGSTITVPMQSETVWNIADFTPVALMGRDDYVLAVKGDAPYKTLDDFIAMARQHGDPVPIGGTNKVSASFIFSQLLADQAKYQTTYVPFEESGQLTTGLLSGNLEAIVTNPGEIAGQLKAGDIRALVFGGPDRLDAFPDVPTVSELGYKIDAYVPRGIVLPPDVDTTVQQFWVDTMKKVAQTDAWNKYLSENYVTPQQQFGADFGTKIKELQGIYKQVLGGAGLI